MTKIIVAMLAAGLFLPLGVAGRADAHERHRVHRPHYVHNSIGYGRFVPGPHGSFGGYPAGSAGAEELRNQQRYKCQAVPEEC